MVDHDSALAGENKRARYGMPQAGPARLDIANLCKTVVPVVSEIDRFVPVNFDSDSDCEQSLLSPMRQAHQSRSGGPMSLERCASASALQRELQVVDGAELGLRSRDAALLAALLGLVVCRVVGVAVDAAHETGRG